MSDPLVSLALRTLMVTPSGALSPGPLTLATISLGVKRGWKAGLGVALGHVLVELSYVTLLLAFFGEIRFALAGTLGDAIAACGAGIVLFFAFSTVRDSMRGFIGKGLSTNNRGDSAKNPVLVGALLTGFNVYFLAWWISVGSGLLEAVSLAGFTSILVMYPLHVWMDFAWLIFVAGMSHKASRFLGSLGYRVLMLLFGTTLALFGLNIVLSRFASITIIP